MVPPNLCTTFIESSSTVTDSLPSLKHRPYRWVELPALRRVSEGREREGGREREREREGGGREGEREGEGEGEGGREGGRGREGEEEGESERERKWG